METSYGSGFRDIDRQRDPERLRAFLDNVRSVPVAVESKRESFGLCELGAGSDALDVGCGTGEDVRELAAIVGRSGTAVGVDRSDRLITIARERSVGSAGTVRFIQAEAAELPFDDDEFDASRADRVLQHIEAADLALEEMARVTRPGGVVVVSEVLTAIEIADPERAATSAALLGYRWSVRERRGWIGPLLPLMLSQAGFIDIALHRRDCVVDGFKEADALLDLRSLGATAVDTAALSADAFTDWMRTVEADFNSGAAVLHCEFLHVTGRKPTWRRAD